MKSFVGKTKVMRLGRNKALINVTLECRAIEQVNSFVNLGSLMTLNGRCTEEIRNRISMGKRASEDVKGLLTTRIQIQLKRIC